MKCINCSKETNSVWQIPGKGMTAICVDCELKDYANGINNLVEHYTKAELKTEHEEFAK